MSTFLLNLLIGLIGSIHLVAEYTLPMNEALVLGLISGTFKQASKQATLPPFLFYDS